MPLNAFDTRSMIAVLDQREPPLTFFLNTFLEGTPQVHESENFDIDVRKAGRRVAPFVSPIREGKVMRREGFKTFTVKPGYLKPKRTITPAECQKRLPGESIFSPRSLQEREEIILAPNVVDTFVKDTTILNYLDNRRVQMGLINPREIAKGVDYIAYLNAPGVYVEIYCDSRSYTDENGDEKQMMPDNTVLLGSTSAQVEMHYGPVQDLDAPAELGLSSGMIPARRFPKTWTEKDPNARAGFLLCQPGRFFLSDLSL